MCLSLNVCACVCVFMCTCMCVGVCWCNKPPTLRREKALFFCKTALHYKHDSHPTTGMQVQDCRDNMPGKELHVSAKLPYISIKETCVFTKELCISAKQPYISAKEHMSHFNAFVCAWEKVCALRARRKASEREKFCVTCLCVHMSVCVCVCVCVYVCVFVCVYSMSCCILSRVCQKSPVSQQNSPVSL